jgi:hypothetical protein
MMCNHAIETAVFGNWPQIGAAPAVHLERAREQARLRTHHPSHSTWPRTGNFLEY